MAFLPFPPRITLRKQAPRATLRIVPQSAYKPPESRDELDELARAIREELQAAGFAPAFDPLPEELERIRRRARRASAVRRHSTARILLTYLAPAFVVVGFALVLRLLLPS